MQSRRYWSTWLVASLALFAVAGFMAASPAADPGILRIADPKAAASITYPLTVVRTGSGSGTVTSNGAINCGGACGDSIASGALVTLTATPDSGKIFTGWLGPCSGTGSCAFNIGGPTTVYATFAPAAVGTPNLDIDGNHLFEPLFDGLLAMRFLLGYTGDALTGGAIGANATRSAAEIEQYLIDIRPALDVDGNGQADAMTD